MKKVLISGLLLLTAFGFLVAQVAAKKREFTGSVNVQIFEKDAAGKFQLVDELKAPSVKFQTSVTDVVDKKKLSSDFVFSGRTGKGKNLVVRLKPGGEGDANLATGFLALNLPFDISIDGQKADSAIKFSTDSVQGANGAVTGKRAVIDHKAHTAKLTLVGSSTLTSNVSFVTAPIGGGTLDQKVEQKAEQRTDKLDERKTLKKSELLLVVNGDGTLKALD